MGASKGIKTGRGLDDAEVQVFRDAVTSKETTKAAKNAAATVCAKTARNPYVIDFVCEVLGSPPQVYLLGCYMVPEEKDSAAKASSDAKEGEESVAVVLIPAEDIKDEELQFSAEAGRAVSGYGGDHCAAGMLCIYSSSAGSHEKAALVWDGREPSELAKDPPAEVATGKVATYKQLSQCTEDDMKVQCAVFAHDKAVNQVKRVINLLTNLKGVAVGTYVDLYEHCLQSATLALRDGADEETIVCALLHDIGELLSPNGHGEVPASILRPYISAKNYWVLTHHEIFQAYYYLDKCEGSGDRDARDKFKGHPYYDACVHFCNAYDQMAFDPEYDTEPLSTFMPMVYKVFRREPYWHLGVTSKDLMCAAKVAISAGYAI